MIYCAQFRKDPLDNMPTDTTMTEYKAQNQIAAGKIHRIKKSVFVVGGNA